MNVMRQYIEVSGTQERADSRAEKIHTDTYNHVWMMYFVMPFSSAILLNNSHLRRATAVNGQPAEKNLGSQVSLNTRIKQLSDRIEAIRNEL